MKTKFLCAAVAAALLSACSDAKQASEVEANFVSGDKYSGMSCAQLRGEATRLAESMSDLEASVDKAYKQDKNMEAVTWILFWPAVFAMDGNDAEAGRLSQAKGEAEAIKSAMKTRGCRMG